VQNPSATPEKKSIASRFAIVVLVAFIIATVASMMTPNLLRSRIAANEASAVGSIRSINTAALTYSQEHPEQGYPQRLAELAPYIDNPLAAGMKSGYTFRYQPQSPDVDGVVKGFKVEAVPVAAGQTGQRRLSGNQTGAISYRAAAGQPEAPLSNAASQPPPPAQPLRRVVRKGSVALIVNDPAQAVESVRAVAARFGGYVESVRFSDQGAGAREASIAIRVPAARFDETRRQVRALGERVQNEQDDARDVTGQYVDLGSNLRNYRAEEQQYLDIMRRSGSIKDTLAVAERLAEVRGRIERAQGQLDLMAHQVEMSALEVTLAREAVVQPVDVHWRPVAQARAAFWDAAHDLADYADFMIAVAFRVPVFLLWMGTIFLSGIAGWRLLRWMWRMGAVAAH
jgi:type II secretory pathway pseudopilin PulG